jgi:hypothetical protein
MDVESADKILFTRVTEPILTKVALAGQFFYIFPYWILVKSNKWLAV